MPVVVGFLVNPIAGMGGSVGLKGTDGRLYIEAVRRGAVPVAPSRALRFLKHLRQVGFDHSLLVAGGIMGCKYLGQIPSLKYKCLSHPPESQKETSSIDTRAVVKMMLERGIDLLVFVGGDGTARDIVEVLDCEVPVLGIPSGVKMYSGIFAASPEAAAELVTMFCEGNTVLDYADVADIDENSLQAGELQVRKFFRAITVRADGLSVQSKDFGASGSSEEKYALAEYFIEEYLYDGILYLLGPGSTVKAITDVLGLPKTILGVDALFNRSIIAKDLGYREILDLLNSFAQARIVVTIIGGQGYLFGRGNQQFTPEVIRRVGRDNILVLATKTKLRGLKYLLVDTGDPMLDAELSGYIRVITGYREETMIRVVPASNPTLLTHRYSSS